MRLNAPLVRKPSGQSIVSVNCWPQSQVCWQLARTLEKADTAGEPFAFSILNSLFAMGPSFLNGVGGDHHRKGLDGPALFPTCQAHVTRWPGRGAGFPSLSRKALGWVGGVSLSHGCSVGRPAAMRYHHGGGVR